tara:strand:- start:56 stop:202 length:147 start_codon:yes stop_codon:yes gene_type:complete
MIDPIEFPFLHCPEIPEAGEDLLDGIRKVTLIDSMRAGIIESRSAKSG